MIFAAKVICAILLLFQASGCCLYGLDDPDVGFACGVAASLSAVAAFLLLV